MLALDVLPDATRGLSEMRRVTRARRTLSRGRLRECGESRISTLFEYESFADYWSTFLTGQGKTGSYVVSLAEVSRRKLERLVRAAYLCGSPTGTAHLQPGSGS